MTIPLIGDGPNAVERFLREEEAKAERKRKARRERAFTEAAETHANFSERVFNFLGLETAAENLRHFREGGGREKIFSRDEIERHWPILAAEEHNRTKFESGTFVADTRNPKARDPLMAIRDGEELPFSDYWNRNIGPSYETPENLLSLGTYLAFGRGQNKSELVGTIRRRRDRIFINGTVSHRLDPPGERYDFHPGQPFAAEAHQLEEYGSAKPFNMQYQSNQAVNAVVRIEEDNGKSRSFLMEKTKWGAIE